MSSDMSKVVTTESNQNQSYSSSSSSSYSSSKTVKTSSTVKTMSMKSTSSSSSVSVRSAGKNFSDTRGQELGIDINAKMKELTSKMDNELDKVKKEFFGLSSLERIGSSEGVTKLDSSTVNKYIDEAQKDKLKFNFDVDEFESESLSVKTVGNKVEVHGRKKVIKDGEEKSEEFSRAYELPTQEAIDPTHVTSSFYKDGVLTVELPVSDAIEAKKA